MSFGIKEISVTDVDEKRANQEDFILLDVRESQELQIANLGEGVVHLPLSQLAEQRLDAIPEALGDKSKEVVVMCHHGGRSAQVAAFLQASGWTNVLNMTGGIHQYALLVDKSISVY